MTISSSPRFRSTVHQPHYGCRCCQNGERDAESSFRIEVSRISMLRFQLQAAIRTVVRVIDELSGHRNSIEKSRWLADELTAELLPSFRRISSLACFGTKRLSSVTSDLIQPVISCLGRWSPPSNHRAGIWCSFPARRPNEIKTVPDSCAKPSFNLSCGSYKG